MTVSTTLANSQEFSGSVEVAEPPEGFVGALLVGEVHAVELLERLPVGRESPALVEQRVEAGVLCVV